MLIWQCCLWGRGADEADGATSVQKKKDFSVLTKTPAGVLHGAACLVWLRIKRCLAAQIADVIFFLLFGEPMCRFCRVNLIYENGR